jgi:hypothetical protein
LSGVGWIIGARFPKEKEERVYKRLDGTLARRLKAGFFISEPIQNNSCLLKTITITFPV